MKISDLSLREIKARLRRNALRFNAGAFTVCVHSPFTNVAEGIFKLYADYDVVAPTEFIDFYVEIVRPPSIRRWFAPQAVFRHDGKAPFKPLPADHAFALFEWAFNWCVGNHAHHYLLIHAAIIEKNGGALILPAPPGSGKSTLCAALTAHGWRLLSDEMTIIDRATGLAVPFTRPANLKNRSIDIIAQTFPRMTIGRKSFDTTKGTVAHMRAPSSSVARNTELASPRWIVFPKYQAESPTVLTGLAKGEAAIQLIENSFNYDLLGKPGFDALTKLVDECECYRFTYSNLSEALALFDEHASRLK